MHVLPRISRRRRLGRHSGRGLQTSITAATIWTVGLIAGLFGLTFGFTLVVKGLPSIQALPVLLDPDNGLLLQSTKIYDRSAVHIILNLDNPLVGERGYIYLDPAQPDYVPQILVQATLAASQPDFYTSPGFSIADLADDNHGTIAQRLVFNLLLQHELPGLKRSLRERILAGQLVSYYGRDQVLEWFLNSAAYGPQVYGVQSAAWAYFGKPPADLSLSEAALLAALAELPEVNPAGLPNLLMQRQKAVIELMLDSGSITTQQAVDALSAQIQLMPSRSANSTAPAFTRLVLAQLASALPGINPDQGGLRIITTLDYDLQNQAACTLQTELAHLAGSSGPIEETAGEPCRAARLLPTLETDRQYLDAAGGAIIIDPQNGQILALASAPRGRLDVTTALGRPAGSLLAPLIYLTAFSRGFTPSSLLWDVPGVSPANAEAYFGPLRLRTALANDYSGPAAQLIAQLGRDSIMRTASQLGVNADFSEPLDSGQITLIQAGQFFALLANEGVSTGQHTGGSNLQPGAILRVERSDGQVLLDWNRPQTRPVISAQLTYLINNILSDEAARWPSLGHPNSLEIGRKAAAKLGTTSSGEDGWAIGYTPQWVVGTWLGVDTPGQTRLNTYAAATWHALSQYLGQRQPSEDWTIPPGIRAMNVCDPSGMLPTAICPAIVSEVFLEGTEPTQADSLYRIFQVNRSTGRLATVFTPPELIEERVYLVAAPEAAEWAQQTGLPIPPNTYDTIYNPPASPNAFFSAPQLFAHVRGSVQISGTASGPDFAFFRLQVGQGLNPQTWLQIGTDSQKPVQNGLLGVWNTQNLSGLYAVQLLVVYKNQRVVSAVTQLTVDNTPPAVEILNPAANTEVPLGSGIVLQVNASDNLELQRVEFWMDGKLAGSLVHGPYNLAWQPQEGRHTLLVKAFDLAGSHSEATVIFTVK